MPDRRRLSIALAVVALTALAGASAPAAAVAAKPKIPNIPNLPRPPKVTRYDALLDVAGYIEVKVEKDDTGDCVPGRDFTIELETSFELGGPRRTAITVVNGAVVSGIANNRGGVSHKGTLAAYRESNYCPPSRKQEMPRRPTCTSGRGRLTAILGSDVSGLDDENAPLSFPVNIGLTRRGGATQDASCREHLTSLEAARRPEASELNLFELGMQGMVIPIGADNFDFSGLRTGRWLRRVVTLNGACDHVLIGRAPSAAAAQQRRSLSKCTVRGRIYVAVKRLPPARRRA